LLVAANHRHPHPPVPPQPPAAEPLRLPLPDGPAAPASVPHCCATAV